MMHRGDLACVLTDLVNRATLIPLLCLGHVSFGVSVLLYKMSFSVRDLRFFLLYWSFYFSIRDLLLSSPSVSSLFLFLLSSMTISELTSNSILEVYETVFPHCLIFGVRFAKVIPRLIAQEPPGLPKGTSLVFNGIRTASVNRVHFFGYRAFTTARVNQLSFFV